MLQGPTNILKSHQSSTICKIWGGVLFFLGGGGRGGFLVHIYPLFNNFGPLHKIQGYQGHQNVTNCRPHHSGDICTTRGNNLKTSFCKNKCIFWGYFGGPERVFNDQTGSILLSSYPLTHIYVHVK